MRAGTGCCILHRGSAGPGFHNCADVQPTHAFSEGVKSKCKSVRHNDVTLVGRGELEGLVRRQLGQGQIRHHTIVRDVSVCVGYKAYDNA